MVNLWLTVSIEEISDPVGMPVPETGMPTSKPATLPLVGVSMAVPLVPVAREVTVFSAVTVAPVGMPAPVTGVPIARLA